MMTEEQLIDRICLTCVDVRHAATDESAQKFINDIRGLAEQLVALTQPASPALKLPDGWVAVPIEPTEEMIAAWRDDMDKSYAKEHAIKIGEDEIVFAHQAMLAAAPAVPHTAPIEPICATGGAEWVKVSEGLPKRGQRVNAFYLNRLGKGRKIRAEYIYSKTEEAGECDPDTQCVEYCEESDTYFVTEGWYEVMDNWEEYGSIAVTEGNITHWMPLPAAPIS